MARVIRPLKQWPVLHHYRCWTPPASQLHLLPLPSPSSATTSCFHFSTTQSSRRPQRIIPNALTPSEFIDRQNPSKVTEDFSDSEDEKKSRNQKKREARRAVRWSMELASFSPPQIKRILRAASLDREVFDALMLVKRLGHDVREGKRRQYNYIGKLLREVEPELMDAAILATKDGDWSRLKPFSVLNLELSADVGKEFEEEDEDEEEEDSRQFIEVASRWFDGLVSKDIQVMNEVYAIRSIDFDRQQLRKLVRKVHEVKESWRSAQENGQEIDRSVITAEKSLVRFLRTLAKLSKLSPIK